MHYRNGREAKEGDRVVGTLSDNKTPVSGVLHSTNATSASCNGRIALITSNDPWITIGDLLHADDLPAKPIPAK